MEIDILSVLLSVIGAGGGGALVAYSLFRRFGDAWLQAKFNEKLEAYRHDRATELERLRTDIDGALQARVRLQEKQFEACLTIWNALKDAQSKLLVSISPLQQYTDIQRMSEEARTEYLSSFDLQTWQVNEIMAAENSQKLFEKTINWMRFNAAAKAFSEFDRVTRSYELFFEPETFALIRSLADAMHSSLVSKEMAIEDIDRKLGVEAWRKYDKECVPLVKALIPKLQELIKPT